MKKVLVVILMLVFNIILISSVQAQESVEAEGEGRTMLLQVGSPYAKINDEFVLIDPENSNIRPVIIESRTLVPIRFISESLKFEVDWKEDERKAILAKDDMSITCRPDSSVIKVDNEKLSLDVPAKIMNDRLYVPLRAISEIFDNNVSYLNRLIKVTEINNSLKGFNKDKLVDIYTDFVALQIRQESYEDESIERWKIAQILVGHISRFHNLVIPEADYYMFPDAQKIPKHAYYNANLAAHLGLLEINRGDFDPFKKVSLSEVKNILEKFKKVLKEKPDLPGEANNLSNDQVLAIINKAAEEAKKSDNRLRASVYDFATNTTVNYNGNQRFYPASLTKVLNLLCYLEEVERGNKYLNSTYKLKESDKYIDEEKVAGTGSLQHQEEGTSYTFDRLLSLMISISDNVASNIVLDALGTDRVNSFAVRHYLNDTRVFRKFYDFSTNKSYNYSTTVDLTRKLVLLENRQVVSDYLSSKGISFLEDTADKNKIGRYAPDNVVVANKIGVLSRMSGDMALVYFPHREPIALTIVIEDKERESIKLEEADKIIGTLSKELIDYYSSRPIPSLYVNGEMVQENPSLRFINSRPFVKYDDSLEGLATESLIISGDRYIALDSLGTEYTYNLRMR
ncbi:hypothetical protein SYNTR_1861 [Candidatus Syntrophocurvum alkaliphilum]|uniref:Uncharacterized protein n=1 Tax=Candidatus Syntrophocurvum alkaliphilum TaxID=2293317 RepID=A0A6I6DCS8_9FIRM|nr:serine hydrolase [Candidatus Syntrophocurvum alkaliphilum]QGU00455.1 hypothetical protein SYNTR_1861 [Candidatus Syntrophocurvum alkaliphilum]